MKHVLSLIVMLLLLLAPARAEEMTVYAEAFSCGRAPFKSQERLFGYVNERGETVIEAQYLSAGAFHQGLAVVQVQGKERPEDQYIDGRGRVVIDCLRVEGRHFTFGDWQGTYGTVDLWHVGKDGALSKTGYNYIGSDGALLSGEEYTFAALFSEGFARVGRGSRISGRVTGVSRDGVRFLSVDGETPIAREYLFIDGQGKPLGERIWADARDFRDGLAAVYDGEGWGFVDREGNVPVEPVWQAVGDFHQGLARVYDGEGWGFVNEKGKPVVTCRFEAAGDFTADGLCAVRVDGKWGYIDRRGHVKVEPTFDGAGDFREGAALVSAPEGMGVIDRRGNWLIPAGHWTDIVRLQECFAAQGPETDGRYALLDAHGNRLGARLWDAVKDAGEGMLRVSRDGLYGYADQRGRLVTRLCYTRAGDFVQGEAMVWTEERWAFVDAQGRDVLPALRVGDRGEAVERLQRGLIRGGYLSGYADGIYGEMTVAAVRAAQEALGMEATGTADSALQYALPAD